MLSDGFTAPNLWSCPVPGSSVFLLCRLSQTESQGFKLLPVPGRDTNIFYFPLSGGFLCKLFSGLPVTPSDASHSFSKVCLSVQCLFRL